MCITFTKYITQSQMNKMDRNDKRTIKGHSRLLLLVQWFSSSKPKAFP